MGRQECLNLSWSLPPLQRRQKPLCSSDSGGPADMVMSVMGPQWSLQWTMVPINEDSLRDLWSNYRDAWKMKGTSVHGQRVALSDAMEWYGQTEPWAGSGVYRLTKSSRQRSKSSQPPLAIQATSGVISRRKTSLERFQTFGTLAGRGRERKGTWTHQIPALIVLHATSNGQPADQVQTDTTVVLHAPNSGLRLESERGLNFFILPQNSSSFEKFQFLSLLNCKRDNILQKISLSRSEDQTFCGCTIWRSDSLSLSLSPCFLCVFSFSHSLVKVKSSPLAKYTSLQHQPKRDGRPPDFNSLWICSQLSLLRTSTSYMI